MQRDICENKHAGNAESKEAFETLKPHITAQEKEVTTVLRRAAPQGLIREELSERSGIKINSVTARVTDLLKKGILRPKKIGTSRSGEPIYEKRFTTSGCRAVVLYLV